MFEPFKQRYKVTHQLPSDADIAIVISPLEDTPGYEDFIQEYAGATFNNGVYRVHTRAGRARWTHLIEEAYPMYRGQFSAFGYDWLGRQFALDSQRREQDQPLIVMYEPGTGLALEVPATFQSFHEKFLIEDSDAALADVFFQSWVGAGNRGPLPTECVGYKVALFLNGKDTLENLELTDMEIYWGITAQLLDQTRDLPDGTPIGKITLE